MPCLIPTGCYSSPIELDVFHVLFTRILYLFGICRRKVLATHVNSGIDISGEILQCLRPGAWLNDEVIFAAFFCMNFIRLGGDTPRL